VRGERAGGSAAAFAATAVGARIPHPDKEEVVYIGIGTVVLVILIVILLIILL
jgi:hypothetical protein